MAKLSAIVLAGGKGTRMNSNLPKVLQLIWGKPIIYWTLNLLCTIGVKDIVVVTGFKKEDVEKTVKSMDFQVVFAEQKKQLGTLNAVETGLQKVSSTSTDILVLYGDDSALYKPQTLKRMFAHFRQTKRPFTILTTLFEGVSYLGGVKYDENKNVVGVSSPQELKEKGVKSTEVVCGAFCFNKNWLLRNINKVPVSSSGEYPLPGLIKVAVDQEKYANTYRIKDKREWTSVNTTSELEAANKLKGELLHD